MRDRINSTLSQIEHDHNVRIFYACESGSRAWGFASQDSDFDVRFLYIHPRDWYLSTYLEHKRDVIELPIEAGLDASGWDIRKALRLFHKSNPPLLEWLGSPIVYLEKYTVTSHMRELATECYSPVASMYHYFKMASGNYREYLRSESVWLKKYLYVLRPVLAVIWLERDLGLVPTEFDRLVEGVVEDTSLREAIDYLLEIKKSVTEQDYGPPIPEINHFLERELKRMETTHFEKHVKGCSSDVLDIVFREAIHEVWAH